MYNQRCTSPHSKVPLRSFPFLLDTLLWWLPVGTPGLYWPLSGCWEYSKGSLMCGHCMLNHFLSCHGVSKSVCGFSWDWSFGGGECKLLYIFKFWVTQILVLVWNIASSPSSSSGQVKKVKAAEEIYYISIHSILVSQTVYAIAGKSYFVWLPENSST